MAKRNGISILCGATNSCLTNLTVSLVMTVFGSTAYEKLSFSGLLALSFVLTAFSSVPSAVCLLKRNVEKNRLIYLISLLTSLNLFVLMHGTIGRVFSFLFEARETGSGDWIAFMPILFLIIIEKALVEIILIALSLTIEKANIKDECKEKKQ